MMYTKDIKNEISRMVNVVNDKFMSKVYPNLPDDLKGCIQQINFQWGHLTEILQTLQQKANDTAAKRLRYPLVFLLTDIPINNSSTGDYPTVSMRIIIAHVTDPNYKADEREQYLFEPFLRPIYKLLMEQIRKSTFFNIEGALIPHTMTERYFWGKSGLFGNTDNIMNDFIDAIEITNLNLRLNKIC